MQNVRLKNMKRKPRGRHSLAQLPAGINTLHSNVQTCPLPSFQTLTEEAEKRMVAPSLEHVL